MKIHVTSTGKTTIDADPDYEEAPIRAALAADAAGEAEPGFIPFSIIDCTDSERSDISHDEYATVTADDGTVLWSGWLDGRDEPAPAEASATTDMLTTWAGVRPGDLVLHESGLALVDTIDVLEQVGSPLTLIAYMTGRPLGFNAEPGESFRFSRNAAGMTGVRRGRQS
jgi:hypothetical protein